MRLFESKIQRLKESADTSKWGSSFTTALQDIYEISPTDKLYGSIKVKDAVDVISSYLIDGIEKHDVMLVDDAFLELNKLIKKNDPSVGGGWSFAAQELIKEVSSASGVKPKQYVLKKIHSVK